MNKTVSIHIQGIPFILEESAYEVLNSYLLSLRNVLKSEEGLEDIIQDVELRIVELLQLHKANGAQVIEDAMIKTIIKKIGNPEDFTHSEPIQDSTSAEEPVKRLFRDKDSAILGGVCAGIASYLNIDVVIIRALYVLAFLTLGVGFLFYIILWIIIPVAKTSSEKLQMKGKAVNIDSIKSELEQAANRIKKGATDLKNNTNISKNTSRLLRVISMILGAFVLVVSTVFLITFLILIIFQPELIPAQIDGTFLSLQQLGSLAFDYPQHQSMLVLGLILICISLVVQGYVIGIRLIKPFGSTYVKYIGISMSILFVVGIILSSYGGIQLGRALAIYGEVEKEVAVHEGPTLNLEVLTNTKSSINGFKTKSKGDEGLLTLKNGNIYFEEIELRYIESEDSVYRITQINDAQGRTHAMALNKARHIKCVIKLEDSTLRISPQYYFPASDKLRDQNIKFQISVPKGRCVTFKGRQVFPIQSENMQETVGHGHISGNGEYNVW
ncbi:MAG: hypothetical protein RL432_1518 [Bacteroidota bacterium]|jgi:phage shock protein PspC (stress-responsive transcriptional regulator)